MSQFRRISPLYCSEWNGDDLNTGTDPTLPKKNISAFGSSVTEITLGSGHYIGGWTGARNLFADGKVKIDLIGTSNTLGQTIRGCEIVNGGNLGGTNQNNFIDCIFKDVASIAVRVGGLGHLRNVFLTDFTALSTNNGVSSSLNSIFLGKQLGAIGYGGAFRFNFVDKNSQVRLDFVAAPLTIENNLINGIILSPTGVQYEAKKLIDGSTRPDADALIPDIVTVFPNFYTQGNFACLESDLKFIDILSRTVEPDSILLQKSSSNGFIGGVKIGKKIDLNEPGFTITKTGIDDSNPNFWKIASGVNFAKIRITGKVSDSLISAQTLDIRIPFNFDGDVAGNTANNNNVPDAWNDRTTPDTKGTRPNRLTFEVRSSTLANPGRDVSADWDNDNTNNPSIAGRYYLMEYGQPMLHHVVSAVAYGNADANAINAATKLPFNYRSLDIIITITNTRTI